MHLSRVLSPVIDMLTPSLFAVRAPLFEAPAVETVTDTLRSGGALGLRGPPNSLRFFIGDTRARNRSAPAAGFAEPFEGVPAACFSLSTTVFQVRTISLASSETSFAACERSLPTARPALLSCDGNKGGGLNIVVMG